MNEADTCRTLVVPNEKEQRLAEIMGHIQKLLAGGGS